jgi:transposase
MMGKKIRDFAALPTNLSLEELVPEENFYRRLDRRLDLSFVRDLVEDRYACSGRPSVDPVVFFRLQLVMFFEDIRSERRLMEIAADRLSIRWFLGYDLNEALPDHSSLTKIRERYGLEVFRRFFERIVEECFEAGLVWGKELYFDATKVEANASPDSMRSRSLLEDRLEEHLVGVFPEDAPSAQNEGCVVAAEVGSAGREGQALAQANALRHRWIAEAGRQERGVVRWGYERMADLRMSTTDPDASPMHQKNKSSGRLGYLMHYVVDGGKARVILDVLVTPAEVTENLPMQELLFRSTFRWGLRPRSVTGDAAYGTKENIAAVEKAGIRAYTALAEQGKRTALFTIEDFVYEAQKDLYTCPQGEILRRRGYDHRGGYVRYAANSSACNECPLKSKCTNSPKGRWVSRSLEEEYLERVRAYRHTEAYRKALRKRAVWVEPLFGEAKEWHGSRRFRLRRLEKVNAEALMIASGHNVKRLLTYGAKGPRRPAQVAALRRPEACCSGFHGVRRHRRRCPWPRSEAFFNRLRYSANFAFWGFSEVRFLFVTNVSKYAS